MPNFSTVSPQFIFKPYSKDEALPCPLTFSKMRNVNDTVGLNNLVSKHPINVFSATAEDKTSVWFHKHRHMIHISVKPQLVLPSASLFPSLLAASPTSITWAETWGSVPDSKKTPRPGFLRLAHGGSVRLHQSVAFDPGSEHPESADVRVKCRGTGDWFRHTSVGAGWKKNKTKQDSTYIKPLKSVGFFLPSYKKNRAV